MRWLLLLALCGAAAACRAEPGWSKGWVPAWTAPMAALEAPHPSWAGLSVRKIVRLGAGGSALRVTLSNAGGTQPLAIAAARVALRQRGSSTVADSDRVLRFDGQATVQVPPGGQVTSDTVELPVPADRDLAVSLFFAEPALVAHVHDEPREPMYTARGDATADADWPAGGPDAGLQGGFAVVKEVEVLNPALTGVVVAFGDSITDGYGVGSDQGLTWPDQLNRRLRTAGLPVVVANAGLSGNLLLRDHPMPRYGRAGLSRLDEELPPGRPVCAVILALGINDLGVATPAEVPGLGRRLLQGYRQAVQRLHARGIRVLGVTLAPFEGTAYEGYFTPAKDRERRWLNQRLRQQRVFDALLDADRLLRDPRAPGRLQPAVDTPDHLHPNAEGARRIAEGVPLPWLAATCRRWPPCSR